MIFHYPTEWTAEQCASQPDEFQKLSDYIYIQRRNIREVTKEDPSMEGESITYFECESRKITKEQYDLLMDELSSPAHSQIVNNQADSMEGMTDIYVTQTELAEAQADVMEALADIYEAVTT